MRREIEARTGRKVTAGAVYTAVDRLKSRGMLVTRVGEPTAERGGRRKNYLRITPRGARALESSYGRLRRMAAGLDRRLAALAESAR